MKKLQNLFLVAIVSLLTISLNAQSVDEIVGNYLENTGGAENWENVKGVRMNASINQMGMEIPIEMVQLKDKMYTKISIQGQEIKQGVFDGETLWSTNFMSMKAEKSDQEDVDNVKNELAEFPDPFLNYKDKGFTVELMGTETVEGSDVYKIKLTKKPMVVDGEEVPNVSIYYFDSENFVPIMVHEEVMSGPGKGMIMESKMSDYQEVEGLYFPFSMTQGVKDQPGQPITIESIELNPSIDDSEFNFPESTEEENN
ncbi:MAG: outer membrane lipoprotein-sorting protein [Bacteroidetes bacterium]|nr:MAG: outer membrane lipoprotein-sorting protein [Bacteroidota bacterium]